MVKKALIALAIIFGAVTALHLYVDHQNLHTLIQYSVARSAREQRISEEFKKQANQTPSPVVSPTAPVKVK